MDFLFRRIYRGPLKAVIFDWAGTTIDYGCRAPAGTFVELFRRHNLEATVQQAREPMGMHKRDHIAAMLAMPGIVSQWEQLHGRTPGAEDVQALFEEFVPLQLEALPAFAQIIPGVAETCTSLHARDMRIGATTGYNAEMMGICLDAGRAAGYVPDASVAVTEVPAGRPAPWMAIKAAIQLQVYPLEAIVKVGDTVTDIDEGLNAGMWTVGVSMTGNELGLSLEEAGALSDAELAAALVPGETKLAKAGAHYVIRGVADLPPILDAIQARIAAGEKP